MVILFVGLDHLVTLRQAGGSRDPDPVAAAVLAELAGAGGISLHAGRARGESGERDLRLLRQTVRTILNVYVPPQEEFVKLVLAVRPDLVTLVPGEGEGVGADRGLDVEDRRTELQPIIETLRAGQMGVSLLVDPVPAQIKAAHRTGADVVLLHTGRLGWAADPAARSAELEGLVNAAKVAHKLGLAVHAGGGLGYQGVSPVAQIEEIEAFHVGHSLVARAALVGIREAVQDFLRLLVPGPATSLSGGGRG